MRAVLRAAITAALCVAALSALATPADRKPARGYPFVRIDSGPGRTNGPVETNVVPLWPIRSCFGWVVVLRGPDRVVEMVEKQFAPGPTRFTGSDIVIGPNSDSTIMRRRMPVVGGKLSHSWCVNDADPPGEWRFEIHVDGVFVAEFRFCGIKLPEGEPFKLEDLACRNTTPSSSLSPPAGRGSG
ncbi:MAG: hypothetical protein FJX20_15280 [Alphaproteobacteria bacterium]|nr:hypothetical protein [Alphaproteobacteria bacterium]